MTMVVNMLYLATAIFFIRLSVSCLCESVGGKRERTANTLALLWRRLHQLQARDAPLVVFYPSHKP